MSLSQAQLKSLIAALTAQVQEEPENFESKVDNRTEAVVAQRLKAIERFERVNSVFFVALEQHLDQDTANLVVECLDRGRKSNNYSSMMKAYRAVGTDIHKRNMLRMVSAIYRKHFTTGKTYQLDSIIKYASSCDHCCDLAIKLQQYLNTNLK